MEAIFEINQTKSLKWFCGIVYSYRITVLRYEKYNSSLRPKVYFRSSLILRPRPCHGRYLTLFRKATLLVLVVLCTIGQLCWDSFWILFVWLTLIADLKVLFESIQSIYWTNVCDKARQKMLGLNVCLCVILKP